MGERGRLDHGIAGLRAVDWPPGTGGIGQVSTRAELGLRKHGERVESPTEAYPGETMTKKPKLVDAADASVKAMNRVKAAVGAVGRALGKTSRPPPKGSSHPAPADPIVDAGSRTARVRFEVQASTEYGQMVCVVGDHAALGAWDPAHAVPLDPSEYPTWTGRVEVEHGRKLEYKYVLRQSDGSCAWEAQTGNRELTVPASGAEVSTRDVADWTA